MEESNKRIDLIDALRGLAVVMMVIHHMLYNLAAFLGAPWWVFTNPVFDFLQYIFIGLFLFLSGVSSRFSRSNVRRGLIAIALAIGISVVTFVMGMPIWFGILHLLGVCMVFFGLTRKFWDLIPGKAAPVVFIPLIAASALARAYAALTSESLWMRNFLAILGWLQPDRFDKTLLPWHDGFVFGSYDYQPIFPWILVFLLGTYAGIYIRERRLPNRFYEQKVPFFPIVGRKALIIYILHQPVMYGIVQGVLFIKG